MVAHLATPARAKRPTKAAAKAQQASIAADAEMRTALLRQQRLGQLRELMLAWDYDRHDYLIGRYGQDGQTAREWVIDLVTATLDREGDKLHKRIGVLDGRRERRRGA